MAINSTYYDGQVQASYAMSSQANGSAQGHLTAKSLISSISASSKYRRRKSKNSNRSIISNDTMYLRSLAEENGTKKIQSSFRLASKLYKSNSDELKLKKRVSKKSNKKSVLTLPNEPSVLPQSCTVSDMNDTEYLQRINKPKLQKTKKRLTKKRVVSPNKNYEYYDKEADYCSQMNVYLDCSSVDVVKNFKGDCKKKTRGANNAKTETEDETTPSDVWTVLRNINRFQFHSSPHMSDDSSLEVMPRKKKVLKKKLKRGVYETCRTEQIAYFSNIKLNVPNVPRDGSGTAGSSQVTVIDKRDEFDISREVENTFDMCAPLISPKIDSAKPTKLKMKNKRSKNSNLSQVTTPSKKNTASKVTLVGLKSQVSSKQVETCNDHYNTFVEIREKNIGSEVTVQTENDFEQKEELNKCSVNTCTMNRATMNDNLDVKAPLHRSLLARVPRSSAQVHLETSSERPLTTTRNAVAGIAGRPLTTAPSKTGASPVNRLLPMGPKTVANSNGHPLTCAPPKTVDRSAGSPLSFKSSNNALAPAGRRLSMIPSKNVTNVPGRPITISSYKTITNPVRLTFSKLQDCPREPMQMVTQSDMRRIIAKIKFPLVILGKDQVRGKFQVEEYDYSQFKGLDEHVWPFMIDWIDKPGKSDAAKHYKNQMKKDKTFTVTEVNPSQSNKKEQMRKANPEVKQSAIAKVKPTSRFRDNILKLLYKKTSRSHQNIVEDTSPVRVQRDVTPVSPVQNRSPSTTIKNFKTVDTATSSISAAPPRIVTPPKTLRQILPSHLLPPTSPSKILIDAKLRDNKPIWGKAKRASDFIENIFKKIKNGTYYTSEIQSKHTKVPLQNRICDTDDLKQVNNSKEVSIQVSLPIVPEDFIPKITIQKKKEHFITLPGFDDVVPQVEIKSMTRNQIAVRHCIANVLLQFDVNMPPEADQNLAFKRSTSFVLMPVTENKTKVFKCKTRILNTVLPAELCSIIPKVMMQFLDREVPLTLTLQEEKRNSALSTISESILPEISEPVRLPLLPEIEMSELVRLRNGRFSKNPKSWTEKSSSNENFYIISLNELPYQYGSREASQLLRPLIDQQYYYIGQPSQTLVPHSTKPKLTSTSVPHIQISSPVTNLCSALVPYTRNTMVFRECTKKIETAPILAFKEFFKMMLKRNISCMSEYFPTIQLQISNNHVYGNSTIDHHQRLSITLCINAANVKLPSFYNASSNASRAIENNGWPEKQIEYIKCATPNELNKTDTKKPLSNGGISKSRKVHTKYVKLYKKCKSMSHIAAEKCSTPLSKVTNLDEFFQALGSGKILSSAVDGRCGSKIMSSISDLKSYITGITPRQALLVMLLANKKDTSNLVRFRPMILQGIAVNRITRVSELDMEVEVIEKERFKMPEYLDKSPLSETMHNNDNLLEELYWIAKTTASDYQRRFDESSEKLLKALLEKRKRLNPSYLRVMARYVGLGLLKTPVNH